MVGADGALTTGLLTALRYVKDNRLLPHGFDKRTAEKDVAVRRRCGRQTRIFRAAAIGFGTRSASRTLKGRSRWTAELWYQPIAYRWAMNLKRYDAMEPRRFVGYYEQTASASGVMLAHASATK